MGLLWSFRPIPGSKSGLRWSFCGDDTNAESSIGTIDNSPISPQDAKEEHPDSHGGHNFCLPGSPDRGLRRSGATLWCGGGALVYGTWCA